MTWTPTLQTISARAIATNLLEYVTNQARQKQALAWAGDGNLPLITKFSRSVANRSQPVYPSIAFVEDNDFVDHGNDVLPGVYSVTFELNVQNADPDTAALRAGIYTKALTSMILNCDTLLDDTGAIAGSVATLETGYEPIKTNDRQNDFLQQVQIRVGVTMTAGAY